MQDKKKLEKVQKKVQMTPEAEAALQKICAEEGMLQIEVVSRLMSWFLRQGKTVRGLVLGHITEPYILQAILEAEIQQQRSASARGAASADEELEAGAIADLDAPRATSIKRKVAS